MNEKTESLSGNAGMEEAKRRVMELQQKSRFAAEKMNGELTREKTEKRENRDAPKEAAASPTDDRDRLFLLSLCMLLAGEGADEGLLVALMYLMT